MKIKIPLLLMLILATTAIPIFSGDLAIRGGTLLTVAEGTIENGTILIRDGKISALGQNLDIPESMKVIEAEGKYVMPSIIDSHSHLALNGDINEATDPVTNTTVKLKYGTSLEEMKIPGVRQQLKMALGENPKRVYGSDGRAPSTRPGIFALLRQNLLDARAYQEKWDSYEKKAAEGEEADPPRRDLKLETLARVLSGEYGVDCHNYVHNEIAVFLDIVEEFEIPYVVISHSFGAYKVRDRIAESGIGVQTHTDWWGYKAEAYDAIPYAVQMLMDEGIVVDICSDSGDVIRRLNREAAKMLRYNRMNEEDALKLITVNPAIILEIDDRTGSLETGKDADIAIFDRHPLDSFSKCVMTLIEGEIYFDIDSAATMALR